MSKPTTVNTFANFMNSLVAEFVKGGRDAAELYLFTSQPELNNPFIKWLLDEGLTWLSGLIDANTEKVMDSLIFDIQTNGEKSDVYKKLNALMQSKGTPDAKTLQAAKDAWASAIHFDGSANVITR